MGGSLVRRLREVDGGLRLLGVDPDTVQGARALEAGLIDEFAVPGDGLGGGPELIVLACPLRPALAFFGDNGPGLARSDTLITDVVSLNAPILARAKEAGLGSRTITAHPMCGSADRGFGAGRADLYQGTRIWLSAGEEGSDEVRGRIAGFWQRVGGDPQWTDPHEHDRTMAWVSHLPQLVSNALAGALDAAGFQPDDLGPGGRDMTRLARSSPEVWRDLLDASAQVTGTGITSVSRALSVLADLLARREVDRIAEFMELTRGWAVGSTEPGASGSDPNDHEADPRTGRKPT